MNKRIEHALNSLCSGVETKRANDELVSIFAGHMRWLYHGHCIAELNRMARTLTLSNCGYQTVSTKARLNAIMRRFGLGSISQKDFVWYHHTKDGVNEWVDITFEY